MDGTLADREVGGIPSVVRLGGGRRSHGDGHLGHRGHIRLPLREGFSKMGEGEEGNAEAEKGRFSRF